MTNKNTIVSVGVFLAGAVLVGLGLWGYGRSGDRTANTTASVQGVSATGGASALSAPDTFYDFGTISMKDGNVSKEFIFTNPTDKGVTITSIVTSCMCTTAYLLVLDGSIKGPFGMGGHGGASTPIQETVRAGESRIIRVVFDPNAHGPAGVGAIDRSIVLTDSSGALLELEIKALVTP